MKKLLVLFIFSCQLTIAQKQVNFSFNLSSEPVEYNHYWKSTGYSPAWMTINEDFKLYLNMLKAMKGDAIEYIRPHYLLNHIKINEPGTLNQNYDWTELDEILDLITGADLKLIFEVMMLPHPYFDDWYDKKKLDSWSKMCTDLVFHLQERYGKETVRSWYFENTNEPDIRHFWKAGTIAFLHYYDATSIGIKKADPRIRFGGPGTALGRSTTYEVFIQHVNDNFNLYTNEKGVICDFITWHRKETPHSMITNEVEVNDFIKRFSKENDKIGQIPIGNDEADPLAGWGRPFWWRSTPWYGAFTAQTVDLHNQLFIDELQKDYFVLSNDNAFMGDWYRRTHVARFIPGDNSIMQKRSSLTGGGWAGNTDKRPETKAFYLIKKPDMTAMSLMAMQGNQRFIPAQFEKDSTAGAMVSKNDKGEYFIITYNKPEIEVDRNKKNRVAPPKEAKRYQSQSKLVNVDLTAIPKGEYQIIQYKIDEEHGNPFQTWLDLESPEDPTISQIKQIQATEDPALTLNKSIEVEGDYSITDDYKMAGVTLTYLAKKPEVKPTPISNLEYHTYNGLNNDEMVMLNWDYKNDYYIKSFDVFYSEKQSGRYVKVNDYDVFELGFLHFGGKKGFYKIQSVDYWNRKSKFSKPIEVK